MGSKLDEVYRTVKKNGLRFAAVSTGATALSQVLLYFFVKGLTANTSFRNETAWVIANVSAVTLSAFPSFYFNRRWVWRKKGGGISIRKEVLPFWAFAFAGLVVSTVTVGIVGAVTGAPLAANAANLTAFALLWFTKLIVFDRKVFGDEENVETGDQPGQPSQPN